MYVVRNEQEMDRKQLLGLACLICVVLIWNFSSYLVKTVYSNFRGPFFLTFFGNSLFALYLPGLLVFRRYFRNQTRNVEVRNYSMLEEEENDLPIRNGNNNNNNNIANIDNNNSTLNPHTWNSSFESLKSKQVFHASLIIAPLWFTSNFLYNLSLLETSVSSSTMISGTSCIFTFCLAYYWKREQFNWYKVLSIFLTIFGMALVIASDSNDKYNRGTCTYNGLSNSSSSSSNNNNNNNKNQDISKEVSPSLLGDLFAFIAAIFYALYIVNIDTKLEKNNSFEDLALFLGYVGLLGFVFCSPIVLILSVTGVENLSELPIGTLFMVFCKGLFDNVLSDLLWAKAVILTSPTVSTIGINMTIPLSIISDWFCGKTLLFAHFLGAISMTSGFILINLHNNNKDADGNNNNSPSVDNNDGDDGNVTTDNSYKNDGGIMTDNIVTEL